MVRSAKWPVVMVLLSCCVQIFCSRLKAQDGGVEVRYELDAHDEVKAVAELDDGSLLVGGSFGIKRFSQDGKRQATLLPDVSRTGIDVAHLMVMLDGRILVGGRAILPESSLRVLTASGILNDDVAANGEVLAIAKQRNGRILVTGRFTALNGKVKPYFGRLLPDGRLDEDFRPPRLAGDAPFGTSVIELLDGRIVLSGRFDHVGEIPRSGIARFTASGELDESFTAGKALLNLTTNGPLPVSWMQSLDDKLAVSFGSNLVWLDESGELAAILFRYGTISAIALQRDGKFLLGGDLWPTFPRGSSNLVRLRATGELDRTFGFPLDSRYDPFHPQHIFQGSGFNTYVSGSGNNGDRYLFKLTNEIPQIRLTVSSNAHQDHFGVRVSSHVAERIRLEVSKDLNEWFSLFTTNLSSGLLELSLPLSATHRFVRVRTD